MDWTIAKVVILLIFGSSTLVTILLTCFNYYRIFKQTFHVEQNQHIDPKQENTEGIVDQNLQNNEGNQQQQIEIDSGQRNQNQGCAILNVGTSQISNEISQSKTPNKPPSSIVDNFNPKRTLYLNLAESLNKENAQKQGYPKFHNEILDFSEQNIMKGMVERQLDKIEQNFSQNDGVNSWIFYVQIKYEYFWINLRMNEKEIVISNQKLEMWNQVKENFINKIQLIKNFNLSLQELQLKSEKLEEQMKELNEKNIQNQN